MVNKANDIYNRWSEGQEVQVVLQHVVGEDAHEADIAPPISASLAINQRQYSSPSPPLTPDSFARSHRSLSQCIAEVHQRAKALYPHRKPCSCSVNVKTSCPPSHFWSPPPSVPQQMSPVLPDLYSTANGWGVLPRNGPALRMPVQGGNGGGSAGVGGNAGPLSPTSKMAVVDTINFELGALNSSSDQSWMSFF